jgi:hypothetical protein
LTPTVLLVVQESVGLFRSAGGLVLLSGRKLGPQMFLPLVPPVCPPHLGVTTVAEGLLRQTAA